MRTGLTMKSSAPLSSPATRSSISLLAVSIRTGSVSPSARIFLSTDSPSMPGIMMSSTAPS